MRDVEKGAEHIADPVARPHRHTAGERAHRQPRTDLAIGPGLEISGIGLDARQAAREQRQAVQCLGVGERIGLAGADALDAMVDRADAGRQPQPFGRVHGDRRIEHHGARDDLRVAEQLLHPMALVGDPGNRAEFAGRQCRRHGDLPHRGRIAGRRSEGAVRRFDGAQTVERLGSADAVCEAQLHRLRAVSDRAAADRRNQIGAGLAHRFGGLDNGAARGVRWHPIEDAGETVAEGLPHFGDLVGRAVERAADHQKDPLGTEPPRLLGEGLGGGLAEHHRLHRAEGDASRAQHDQPTSPRVRKRCATEACIAIPTAMQSSFNIMWLEWHGAT